MSQTSSGGSVAITLTQPWATLVVSRQKWIETRSWRTPHRGRLGIHAAKGFPRDAIELCFTEPFASALKKAGIAGPGDLPRGQLLGFVDLTNCLPTDGLELGQYLSPQERAFGDYGPGRWGWLLGNIEALDEPIPMRGALSLWRIPEVPSVA